jgi:hypothetical protein
MHDALSLLKKNMLAYSREKCLENRNETLNKNHFSTVRLKAE